MKKCYALLIALVLIFAAATAAMAETGLELVRSGIENRLVEGTYLYDYFENGLFGLADADGNRLTEAKYADMFYRQGNLVLASDSTVAKPNNVCAFLPDGTLVIEPKYGDIRSAGGHWAICFVCEPGSETEYDSYSVFNGQVRHVSADLYNLKTGASMLNVTSDQIENFMALNTCINLENSAGDVTCYDEYFNVLGTDLYSVWSNDYEVFDRQNFYENDLCGWKDPSGNVVLAPTYDEIYAYQYGYARIQGDNGLGLIDAQGNLILEPIYDFVNTMYNAPLNEDGEDFTYGINGYYCIEIGDNLGYADAQGITCQPKYDAMDLDECGLSATYTDESGNTWLIAADGVETRISGYDDFFPMSYMGGVYYYAYDENGMAGMIDWHGNEVLPCEYIDIVTSGDGKYVCASKDFITFDVYEVSYPQGRPGTAAPAAVTNAPAAVTGVPVTENAAEQEPADDTIASALAAFLNMTASLPTANAPAAEEETVENVDTDFVVPEITVEPPTMEMPAVDEPAVQADTGAAKGMLESVRVLLNLDPATNKAAAAELIRTASAMLSGSNLPAATLLDSALTLLEADAAANGAAVITLLDSVITLL